MMNRDKDALSGQWYLERRELAQELEAKNFSSLLEDAGSSFALAHEVFSNGWFEDVDGNKEPDDEHYINQCALEVAVIRAFRAGMTYQAEHGKQE